MEVLDLANYIVDLCQRESGMGYNNQMTNLRLQKILYYVQGYSYRNEHCSAFDSEIYCWPYGPVVLDAYYHFNMYRSRPIIYDETAEVSKDINYKYKDLVKRILDSIKTISTSNLVEKTHQEIPWKSHKISQLIPKNEIEDFFNNNNPLGLEN